MPNPVSETIVEYVITKLREIAIDDDFEFDVVVKRAKTGANSVGDENVGVVILVLAQTPTDAPDIAPLTLDGYRMQVLITAILQEDINDDEQGAILSKLNADLVKTFGTDYTLGGNCFNSRFTESAHGTYEGGDIPAVTKTLEVSFFTEQGDPYTAA